MSRHPGSTKEGTTTSTARLPSFANLSLLDTSGDIGAKKRPLKIGGDTGEDTEQFAQRAKRILQALSSVFDEHNIQETMRTEDEMMAAQPHIFKGPNETIEDVQQMIHTRTEELEIAFDSVRKRNRVICPRRKTSAFKLIRSLAAPLAAAWNIASNELEKLPDYDVLVAQASIANAKREMDNMVLSFKASNALSNASPDSPDPEVTNADYNLFEEELSTLLLRGRSNVVPNYQRHQVMQLVENDVNNNIAVPAPTCELLADLLQLMYMTKLPYVGVDDAKQANVLYKHAITERGLKTKFNVKVPVSQSVQNQHLLILIIFDDLKSLDVADQYKADIAHCLWEEISKIVNACPSSETKEIQETQMYIYYGYDDLEDDRIQMPDLKMWEDAVVAYDQDQAGNEPKRLLNLKLAYIRILMRLMRYTGDNSWFANSAAMVHCMVSLSEKLLWTRTDAAVLGQKQSQDQVRIAYPDGPPEAVVSAFHQQQATASTSSIEQLQALSHQTEQVPNPPQAVQADGKDTGAGIGFQTGVIAPTERITQDINDTDTQELFNAESRHSQGVSHITHATIQGHKNAISMHGQAVALVDETVQADNEEVKQLTHMEQETILLKKEISQLELLIQHILSVKDAQIDEQSTYWVQQLAQQSSDAEQKIQDVLGTTKKMGDILKQSNTQLQAQAVKLQDKVVELEDKLKVLEAQQAEVQRGRARNAASNKTKIQQAIGVLSQICTDQYKMLYRVDEINTAKLATIFKLESYKARLAELTVVQNGDIRKMASDVTKLALNIINLVHEAHKSTMFWARQHVASALEYVAAKCQYSARRTTDAHAIIFNAATTIQQLVTLLLFTQQGNETQVRYWCGANTLYLLARYFAHNDNADNGDNDTTQFYHYVTLHRSAWLFFNEATRVGRRDPFSNTSLWVILPKVIQRTIQARVESAHDVVTSVSYMGVVRASLIGNWWDIILNLAFTHYPILGFINQTRQYLQPFGGNGGAQLFEYLQVPPVRVGFGVMMSTKMKSAAKALASLISFAHTYDEVNDLYRVLTEPAYRMRGRNSLQIFSDFVGRSGTAMKSVVYLSAALSLKYYPHVMEKLSESATRVLNNAAKRLRKVDDAGSDDEEDDEEDDEDNETVDNYMDTLMGLRIMDSQLGNFTVVSKSEKHRSADVCAVLAVLHHTDVRSLIFR